MTCYILGCPGAVSHSARHRRFGLVITCRRHDPATGGLGLPVVLSGPVLPAPARLAPPPPPAAQRGDPFFGPRVPATPPPPTFPSGAPALAAPVAPRSPAYPAELRAPARDASALIAF